MNMKKALLFLLILTISTAGLSAGDRIDTYQNLLKQNEFEELRIYLEEWEDDAPEDPELYIAWFNYYLRLDSTTVTSTHKDPWSGRYLLAPVTRYDMENVRKAVAYLDRGIELAPTRLDMHFGKIRALTELGEYGEQSALLAGLMEHSIEIDHDWYWSRNERLRDSREDPKEILLGSIQDYIMLWKNIGTDASLSALKEFSEAEKRLYPDVILGYSNYALYYLETGEYASALEVLLETHELFPDDYIIIHNIGNCYEELGRKEPAREFYEKLYSYPDEVDSSYVDELIEAL